eukprot:tig00000114_g6016.t1
MSRLALPPEIPAKLAKNTLYDVLCVGDSFGVDWTVFERISDQAKEAQARALEDGMQFSPNSKDVLRKTELAERKRKLAAARTLNLEAPPARRGRAAMHAALNMTEENFDTPSKPKPGAIPTPAGCSRAAPAAAHGAVPRHIAKGEWRTIGLLAGPEEFYFNRMRSGPAPALAAGAQLGPGLHARGPAKARQGKAAYIDLRFEEEEAAGAGAAELAVQPREAPEIDMSKYDDVTRTARTTSPEGGAIQDALRLFVKTTGSCAKTLRPNSPPTFYVELPNLFVYDKLLAMTFHKTYESNPGSFEFTFSKECSRADAHVRGGVPPLEDVCPEMPVIPGFAFACDTRRRPYPCAPPRTPADAPCADFVVRAPQDSTGSACVLVMTHEEARERYAGYMNTCYIRGACPRASRRRPRPATGPPCTACCTLHAQRRQAPGGQRYVTADEFGYAAAVLYAFNLVGPWNFCDKPVSTGSRAEIEPPSEGAMLQYCGIIKGQSGTGKSMVTQIMTECRRRAASASTAPPRARLLGARRRGGDLHVMAEGLDPKACSEEELKMRSGDAYPATSRTSAATMCAPRRRARCLSSSATASRSSRTACSSSSPASS